MPRTASEVVRAEAVEVRDELHALRNEVHRLSMLIHDALVALRRAGASRDAARLERELGMAADEPNSNNRLQVSLTCPEIPRALSAGLRNCRWSRERTSRALGGERDQLGAVWQKLSVEHVLLVQHPGCGNQICRLSDGRLLVTCTSLTVSATHAPAAAEACGIGRGG